MGKILKKLHFFLKLLQVSLFIDKGAKGTKKITQPNQPTEA